VAEYLMKIDVFPVCSPALLGSATSLTCADELSAFTLLHSSWVDESSAAPGWRMWLRAAGATGVDPERGPRSGNDSMLVEAALAGQGVALVYHPVVAGELASGRLICPFPKAVFEETVFCYFLVYPERHRSTPKVLAFRDWLFAEVLRDEPLLRQ